MKTITRFSKKSTNQREKSRRQQCVASSYQEASSKGVKVNEFDVEFGIEKGPVSGKVGTKIGGWGVGSGNAYAKASAQCDKNSHANAIFGEAGLKQTDVISTGALPYSNKEKWIEAVEKNPSPVKMTLSPITDLLTEQSLNHIPLDPSNPNGEMLDADLIKSFYTSNMGNYCEVMLGGPCRPVKGCSVWNDCHPDSFCEDDDSDAGFHCYNKGNE